MSTRNIIIAVVILVILYLLFSKKKQAVVANTGTGGNGTTGTDLTVINNTPLPTVLNPVPNNIGNNIGGMSMLIVPMIVQPQNKLYPVQSPPQMVQTVNHW